MNINIRKATLPVMLEIVDKIKKQQIKREEIKNLLDHPDYRIEFERYGNSITKEAFIEYLLNVENLKENEIKNNSLKIHHRYYQDLFTNLEDYKNKLSELDEINKEVFENQIDKALKGLPEGFEFEELNFLFTIGIGQSFGYVYKNYMHFDFLQLIKEHSLDSFFAVLAHEIHHVGLSTYLKDLDETKLLLEDLFYLYFVGEGLAVKYCNNAEGVLSKSIDDGPKNNGLDEFSWNYLNNDFENTMKRFKQTIENIRSGKINSLEKLQQEMMNYWMNPYTEDQTKDEIPKLLQLRLYSFGNDIWGIIHDVFGKAKVYETLDNISDFPKVFNAALEKINKGKYKIC